LNPTSLSPEIIQQWRKDGAVCLRDVFDQPWIDLLEAGFEAAFNNPSKLSKDYAKAGQGSFYTDHGMHRHIEQIHDFVHKSPAAKIGAALMAASRINLIDDHLLLKEPGTENPTYWHQDQPYFNFAGEDFVSLWIPIDPADEQNGTMRFAKGSHLWGKQFHPVRIGLGEIVDEAEDFDGPAPDIDANLDEYDVLSWNLSPGDCLAFHGKMLHAAYPNSSKDSRRRALALRLTGNDIVWHVRSYAPTEIELPDLKPGGPITCEEYPAIWP
jgi:ectoine hydroxylase-related dioxygenase (phytanoyl-CoA dioxygenase family)